MMHAVEYIHRDTGRRIVVDDRRLLCDRYYSPDAETNSMVASDKLASSPRGRQSKVARLLEEHDLLDLGDELERLWTADEDRYSLRELAGYFNQQILYHRLKQTGTQVLDGETENIYRLLTDDNVSSAERTRVRRRLERKDIDVESLKSDFVTYQAIRTYLQNYRDAEYDSTTSAPLERERKNLQQLQGRITAVTEQKLEQLRDNEELPLDEFRTLVNIQVVCTSCNTRHDVFDLLEQGGCSCSDN